MAKERPTSSSENFPEQELSELDRVKAELKQSKIVEEEYAKLIDKIGTKADVSFMEAREQRNLANTDDLTGLFNRRGFRDAFEKLLKNPARMETGDERKEKEKFTALLMDLDNFKGVNDKYGHDQGDEVLKQAADYLKSQIRANDIIERFGGEEFLIVLARADANAIINKLSGKTFPGKVIYKGGKEITLQISFSGGATSFDGKWDQLKEAVLVADEALYVAKKNGKNQILTAQET